MHYYQFNVGDYTAHTKHLTLLEDIAYRRLLDLLYLHEQPLMLVVAITARKIGMADHIDVVESVLNEFFQKTKKGWTQSRATLEIDKFHGKIKQASDAGKASAEARKNKVNGRSTDSSTGVQPNIKQETRNKKQETTLANAMFETWWLSYPRKVAKQNAFKSFLKLSGDEKQKAIDVIPSFKSHWESQGTEERFIPHPATWLNGKYFETPPSTQNIRKDWE